MVVAMITGADAVLRVGRLHTPSSFHGLAVSVGVVRPMDSAQ